jgi:hypothetical protein
MPTPKNLNQIFIENDDTVIGDEYCCANGATSLYTTSVTYKVVEGIVGNAMKTNRWDDSCRRGTGSTFVKLNKKRGV